MARMRAPITPEQLTVVPANEASRAGHDRRPAARYVALYEGLRWGEEYR